jgi:AcrR family transcriptional regulator
MSTTKTPRKPRTTDKRERMLLAARELLRQKHFEEVTIPDLARAAGVAVGTFYLYFNSKTELIEALAIQFRNEITKSIQPLFDSGASLRDILEPLVECVQRVAIDYQDVLHLFGSEALFFTELADTQDQMQLLKARLAQERDVGLLPNIRNPTVTANLLDALIGRMVLGRLRASSEAEAEVYRSEVLRMMSYLLR